MIGDGATDLEACPPAVSISYVVDHRWVKLAGVSLYFVIKISCKNLVAILYGKGETRLITFH